MAEPRQFEIRRSVGGFYWRCRWCLDLPDRGRSWGWAKTITAAADAARMHVPNCPCIIAELEDIFALPDYRDRARADRG